MTRSVDIVSVVGARPQFVKAGVVSRALKRVGLTEVVVHTGQHYDDAMSGRFLRELGIANIAANLSVGSGSHAVQTARTMTGLESFLEGLHTRPRAVLVYGDTNSTIGASLVASKLAIPIIHVEAGLRSYNRLMPEEINRIVTDHLSSLLFCSSQTGVENLRKEGITQGVMEVGDVMLDAFLIFSEEATARIKPSQIAREADAPFVLATIHRPSNTDDPGRLGRIIESLGRLAHPVIWPVHPRNAPALSGIKVPANIFRISPVSYLEMLVLLTECLGVVTDSGGLQKEAHWARRKCITLRDETEWVETLVGGWNVLAHSDSIEIAALLAETPATPWSMLYGDGRAAVQIAQAISTYLAKP